MRLFKFRYPKLLGLIISIVLAYYIFKNPIVAGYISHLNLLGYFGTFFAGMLFAFGFTAPIAAGFFITLNPANIWLAGVIGGCGALIADLIIFRFIRLSFEGEFNLLKKNKTVIKTGNLIERSVGKRIQMYLMYTFAGILIASPLPDEAGIIMLAGLTQIDEKTVAKLGFALNTIGILALLAL
ncbi:MAG: hypothetical protein KKB21_00825 [Nanoarchaeota archaeon]|nr:hypothetical protein [Nanoarchaeota archaeon]MBU4086099.1 hypothetical protein [Nanoarchaeota archaeon]